MVESDLNGGGYEALVAAAVVASEGAYCKYSRFHVGAALLTASGAVYTGCNIENSSYGATNCAERTAIFKAVSEGKRDFTAIAIYGWEKPDEVDFCMPCGICRQVMREFCAPDFEIAVTDGITVRIYTLDELLPHSFSLN